MRRRCRTCRRPVGTRRRRGGGRRRCDTAAPFGPVLLHSGGNGMPLFRGETSYTRTFHRFSDVRRRTDRRSRRPRWCRSSRRCEAAPPLGPVPFHLLRNREALRSRQRAFARSTRPTGEAGGVVLFDILVTRVVPFCCIHGVVIEVQREAGRHLKGARLVRGENRGPDVFARLDGSFEVRARAFDDEAIIVERQRDVVSARAAHASRESHGVRINAGHASAVKIRLAAAA